MGVSQHRALYLMYHRVARELFRYPYTIRSVRFEEHLRVAAALERDHLSLSIPCFFTFDDGHLSNYQEAMPLLAAQHRTASFFVTAGWIENRIGFMGWSQVKELKDAGHTIGSHGWSHMHLTECSDPELQNELYRSKATLEQRLGASVESISVPGGRWNRRVLRACAAAGYRLVFTSDPGTTVRLQEHVQVFPRLNVTESLDAAHLLRILSLKSRSVGRARALHQAKQVIRQMVGDHAYHALWCAFSHWKDDEEAEVNSRESVTDD